MLNNTFYHSLTRKYCIAFGNLFNDIYIRRFNKDKNVVQQIPVPIQWGPKQKWAYQLAQPVQDRAVAIQVPRMGFYFSNIAHDPNRQINPLNINSGPTANASRRNTQFGQIPYKITAELSIYAKNADDAAQILEQIIPYFTPTFTQQLKLIPELDLKMDVGFTLMSIGTEDVYEDEFTARRFIIYTLSFEINAWFFGPVSNQGVIKRVFVNLFDGTDPATANKIAEYTVQPGLTKDSKPTTDINQSIPYQQIQEEDDYGFIEEWKE